MNHTRALIIFAKMPRPGEVKTRLGKTMGMHEAARVYAELAERTFQVGRDLGRQGCKVFLFYDPSASETNVRDWVKEEFLFIPQQGDTLGERMHHAFDVTFQQGTERTVIVGTDIPDLELALLQEAFDMLGSHDVVVGPTTDGGYYLLGMKPPTKDIFSGIAWSTPVVYADTVRRIGRLGLSLSVLRELVDIDTEESYNEYTRRSPSI
ncbi:MAG: hypothetical protein HW412_2524 [Bacteroidetes bacterium]|nr:hypothetical protein [Bacteroidota bacterium]